MFKKLLCIITAIFIFTTPLPGVKSEAQEGDSVNNTDVTKFNGTRESLVYETGLNSEVISFDGKKGMDVPAEVLSGLGSEITIAFWQFGHHNTNPQSVIFNAQSGSKSIIKLRFPMIDGTIIWTAGGDALSIKPAISHIERRWNHWVFTKNANTGLTRIYLNGVLINTANNATRKMEAPDAVKIGSQTDGSYGYMGLVTDFRIYIQELNPTDINEIYKYGRAVNPNPVDESNLIKISGRVQPLSWTASSDALSHDVYFGNSYSDVENATKDSPEYKGNHSSTTYAMDKELEEGITYYWRVDQVTSSGTKKGFVWRFQYNKWDSKQYKEWGDEALALIEKDFRVKGTAAYYEDNKHNARSFMWPSSILIMALSKASKVSSEDYSGRLKEFINYTDKHWAFAKGLWGYDCVANPGTTNRFYDDNTWMVWGLIEAYEVLKSDFYLKRAKEAFKFILSGEDDTYGGGIWWKETQYQGDPPRMKAVSSTAGAAIAGAKLYSVTGDEAYLNDSLRMLDWLENNVRDENGLIMNDVTENGVGRSYWTYNTAVPMYAYAILYGATKNEEYLAKAVSLSRASEVYWIDKDKGTINDESYFAFTLANGWIELYNQTGDTRWLGLADKAIRTMHENSDINGRYPVKWTDTPGTLTSWNLLITSAAARIYWAAADVYDDDMEKDIQTVDTNVDPAETVEDNTGVDTPATGEADVPSYAPESNSTNDTKNIPGLVTAVVIAIALLLTGIAITFYLGVIRKKIH